jgi:hypothetical protein
MKRKPLLHWYTGPSLYDPNLSLAQGKDQISIFPIDQDLHHSPLICLVNCDILSTDEEKVCEKVQ